MDDATAPSNVTPGTELAPANLIERARAYAKQATAKNTRRAYRADWACFSSWCEEQGLESLPTTPEALILYITTLAERGMKVATIVRRLTTIRLAHSTAELEDPTDNESLRQVFRGIKRALGVAQETASPLLIGDLRHILAELDESPAGLRDRVLLLMGFAGAFRRGELVALNLEDLERTSEGLVVTLRHSKTDQEGEGRKVGIPRGRSAETCPVRALDAWLDLAGITTGAIFRSVDRHGKIGEERLSARAVSLVVKRAVTIIGLDPGQYAGHSLRAGLATSAATAGASERAIMRQTGHRSVTMVRRYIRDGELFRENAAASVL